MTAIALIGGITSFVWADDESVNLPPVVDKIAHGLTDTINNQTLFQWVEIETGLSYTKNASKHTLAYALTGFTAFRALQENNDSIWYAQGSYNGSHSANHLSLGIGYRRMVQSTYMKYPLILGINGFIDGKDGKQKIWSFKSTDTYQQYSVGFEAKTHTFDISANIYRPITQNVILDKKVQSGYDVTFKSHIHRNEKFLVGATVYQFDPVKVGGNKLKGTTYLAEYRPNQIISIATVHDTPKGGKAEIRITIDFKFSFGKSLSNQLRDHPHTTKNPVWHKRYDKTHRQSDIKIDTGTL